MNGRTAVADAVLAIRQVRLANTVLPIRQLTNITPWPTDGFKVKAAARGVSTGGFGNENA